MLIHRSTEWLDYIFTPTKEPSLAAYFVERWP
jgi:hypothetical protein